MTAGIIGLGVFWQAPALVEVVASLYVNTAVSSCSGVQRLLSPALPVSSFTPGVISETSRLRLTFDHAPRELFGAEKLKCFIFVG